MEFIKADEERERLNKEVQTLKSGMAFLLLQVVTMQAELLKLAQTKRDRE